MTNNLTTQALLNQLKEVDKLEDYFNNYASEISKISFSNLLNTLLYDRNTNISDVLRKTNITKSYIYKIFSGEKKPSRDHIIQIGIALKCEILEMNMLLTKLEYSPLYPRISRDSVLIFAIEKDFSVHATNDLLIKHLEKPFFHHI